ncbi:hypothetical protein N7522_000759 [Penicillium canescens]|uniref:Uncharacterized protein n=1 Tax=Penicillium canescens TaxID=5083 RepID=A0AAD6IMW4_PENCN|nr:uncharacterized protein N7446_007744 [Penicillium canescens]KAJ6018692.1 hypothetical protein N7522_000759 [Penicillium canescens]KAJ6033960.1 hypothetical protein N7444_011731 [Penicillium canescens]KAJ6056852.1 hypothetical protein N7460_000126 [Penicillium canescens]KAJ6058161.1 hypothetical protein N7446_007744 [Penicillium canescens]
MKDSNICTSAAERVILQATLLSHGYTVFIKATTTGKEHHIRAEVDTYSRLRSLQGYQIPVYVRNCEPRVTCWYRGLVMAHVMILSWSGVRIQQIINEENSSFFYGKREKVLETLRLHGVVPGDKHWRNMLWNE